MFQSEYCRCGHARSAHEHYRRGTDCALCGRDLCPNYRPATPWYRRLLGQNETPPAPPQGE